MRFLRRHPVDKEGKVALKKTKEIGIEVKLVSKESEQIIKRNHLSEQLREAMQMKFGQSP